MFVAAHHLPNALRRLTGALGVVLVLMLTILAARPDLHETLCRHQAESHSHSHHHDAPPRHDHDHGGAGLVDACIITLFAQGHILIAPLASLLLLIASVRAAPLSPTRGIAFASADHGWLHDCGPPLR